MRWNTEHIEHTHIKAPFAYYRSAFHRMRDHGTHREVLWTRKVVFCFTAQDKHHETHEKESRYSECLWWVHRGIVCSRILNDTSMKCGHISMAESPSNTGRLAHDWAGHVCACLNMPKRVWSCPHGSERVWMCLDMKSVSWQTVETTPDFERTLNLRWGFSPNAEVPEACYEACWGSCVKDYIH